MKWIVGILAAVSVACLTLGCQMTSADKSPATQPRFAELPPVPDRLRAFYQDIQAGKFEILADFEQPAQAEIFHVDGSGSAVLTVRRSRIPTGAGALEVRLDNAESILVVDAQAAKDWTLSRDWSRYQLLMASVYAPASIVTNLQIRSGTDEPAWYVSAPKPLQAGWNLLRVDLSEVGRRVNLTDIRQIRLTAKAGAWPLTVYLDDLVLADNTTTVYGDPKGEPGSLYVLKKGHRYHAGAAGRFELVFNRGVLTSWYDLASDPGCAVDLAGGGPAGPVLTALDETGAPLGGLGIESWMGLGNAVQTHLQVVETSPLAVTIKGTVRYAMAASESVDDAGTHDAAVKPEASGRVVAVNDPQAASHGVPAVGEAGSASDAVATTRATDVPAAAQPAAPPTAPIEHTYVYTIRQDGRVFVDITATVATATFQPARIGLAITNLGAVFQAKQVDPLDADLLKPQASAGVVVSKPQASAGVVVSKPQASAGVAVVARPSPAVAVAVTESQATGHGVAAVGEAGSAGSAATDLLPDDAPKRAPIPRALLLAGVRTGGGNLLLAPCNVGLFERVVSATRQTGDVTAHMYVMGRPAADQLRLAAMLAVWPPDLKDLPTAAAIARDYQQPGVPKVEVGKLRTDTDGDLDGDGYAEATGRWMVEPDGQILRLRWPAGQLRFWPMLQVTGLSGKACWPYLDGRILKPVHRRSDGNAEFVVPGILSREALLEVTVEKEPQEPASQPASTPKVQAKRPMRLFAK